MYSNKFVICDRDEKYLRKLQEYLINRKITNFEVIVFTDLESAKKYSTYEPYEIILVGENVYDDSLRSIMANHKYVLIEKDVKLNMDYPVISKYQSVEGLLTTLFESIAKEDSSKNVVSDNLIKYGSSRTKLISFYSPLNHVKQTGMAIDTALKYGMQGHKVLYLNLTAFSGLEQMMNTTYDTDVTDFMYYVLNHSDKVIYKLEILKSTLNGIDYLPPARDYQDIIKISEQDWMKGMNILLHSTDYDEIVLDLSEACQALEKILEKSEIIYTIVSNDNESVARINQYMTLMSKRSNSSIIEKTNYIYLNGESSYDQIRAM